MRVDDDEQMVRALQQQLVHDEAVPLGLIARLDANVARAIRARDMHMAWEARVVIACLTFVVIGCTSSIALTPQTALVLAGAAALYAWRGTPETKAAVLNDV